jgi:3',5'-cyclic AMP phosphodiesterase CpdA
MRLAHISDLHLLDLTGIGPRRFLNRRVLGGMNILVRRAREYRPEILEWLVDDLLREEVDHVAVTGDLSNLALESEFERVFHLLRLLGGWDRVSIVPGNHDYYTFKAADTRRFEKVFYPFMFEREFSDLDVDVYPFVKNFGEMCIVGLNSATRTIPPLSYGTIGSRQLALVEKILARAHDANRFTCLMLHHPLHKRDRMTEMASGLLNREKLLELIDKYRVGLVLHGHDHAGRITRLEQHGHVAHIICCGSSTRLIDDPMLVARYRVITIEQGRVRRIETKVLDASSRRFLWE